MGAREEEEEEEECVVSFQRERGRELYYLT